MAGRPRWRKLRSLVRGRESQLLGAIGLSLGGSLLGLAQPLVVREVVGGAGALVWNVLLLAGLFLAQAVVAVGGRVLLARTGEQIVLGLRLTLIGRLLRLWIRDYGRHRRGDLISRTTTDCAALKLVATEGITDLVTGSIGVVGAGAVMFWLDPALFAVVAGLVMLATLVIAPLLRRIRAASYESQTGLGLLTADLDRALGAIRTVRASRAHESESARIGERARSVFRANLRTSTLQGVIGPAIELAVNGAFIAVLIIGGVRTAHGGASLADLVAFLLYMMFLSNPIMAVFQSFSTVQQAAGALARIEEVAAIPVEPVEPGPTARPAGGNGTDLLEFRGVWFGYRDRPVLRDLSFTVPPTGRIALLGRSGAGKSTVFGLVARFFDPDRGQILLHGTDVTELGRGYCRSRVALVEQDAPVLRGSLRENLCYTAGAVSEPELARLLDLVNLGELVERLPQGLDTDVGEHGTALSGGERQRIAIGRALLARPELLLLDEPTSQLDVVNEAILADTVARVSAERAVLIIAHRFSTVREADRVVILEDGHAVAAGTHDELLVGNEFYRRLAEPFGASTA